MSKTTSLPAAKATGDLVLREVWRAKDTLSARYGHDLDRLLAETSQREVKFGHPLVKLPAKSRKV